MDEQDYYSCGSCFEDDSYDYDESQEIEINVQISVNYESQNDWHGQHDENQNQSQSQQQYYDEPSVCQQQQQFNENQPNSSYFREQEQQDGPQPNSSYFREQQPEFDQQDPQSDQRNEVLVEIHNNDSESIHYQLNSDMSSYSQIVFTSLIINGPDMFQLNQDRQQSPRIAKRKGLTINQISQFPQMVWRQTHNLINFGQQCSCCLENFKIKDSLRVVSCMHRFHSHCIDKWFQYHTTCPLCKKDYKKFILQ